MNTRAARRVHFADASGYPYYVFAAANLPAGMSLNGTTLFDPWGNRWQVLVDFGDFPGMEALGIYCVPGRSSHADIAADQDKYWTKWEEIQVEPNVYAQETRPPSWLTKMPLTNTMKIGRCSASERVDAEHAVSASPSGG